MPPIVSIEPKKDVLGERYMRENDPAVRRLTGSTYTPEWLVGEMVATAAKHIDPDIIVDCGCGSGRFAVAAALAFPKAAVIAVDTSAEACLMCRENAEANNVGDRVEIVNDSFLNLELPAGRGRVLWIGNPPYVRHHNISEREKKWYKDAGKKLGIQTSALSGLHVYFLAKIAEQWALGDFGVLVTSAEWLDVNYGRFPRALLTSILPLTNLKLCDRSTEIFEGTATTAVVFAFGEQTDPVPLDMQGKILDASIAELGSCERWSNLHSEQSCQDADKLIPLGEIAAVHRGVVTGNNGFWVRSENDLADVPESLTQPIIAHAREITGDCPAQSDPLSLKRLIALPEDLSTLTEPESEAARKIIAEGLSEGVDEGYVASHRRAWWSIKPPEPPAILMTYMARKPPRFVVNNSSLPMLNVVHGIYPHKPMSDKAINNLATYLNESVLTEQGRTYCGGLVKFEPREAERIPVPTLEALETGAWA